MKFNVVLTLIEMTALLIVIAIGFVAAGRGTGDGDIGEPGGVRGPEREGLFLAVTIATTIAFFAMVGFEDSVNMVEETKDPEKIFPRMMFTGLGDRRLALRPRRGRGGRGARRWTTTPATRASCCTSSNSARRRCRSTRSSRILTVFAVANTALINMLMASRLIYGMARQRVLPTVLGRVLPGRRSPWTAIVFTTLLALVLIIVVNRLSGELGGRGPVGHDGSAAAVRLRGGQRRLLVLRRNPTPTVFRAPTWVPFVGAVLCLFLTGPWARTSAQMIQYKIAGGMLLLGVVLWVITYFLNKREGEHTDFDFIDDVASDDGVAADPRDGKQD